MRTIKEVGKTYDVLDFEERVVDEYLSNHYLAVTIINGAPLLDIVDKYERIAAENVGYKYVGPGYEYQYSIDLYCQLMEKASCASDNEPSLMICGCLEEGCHPLLVTITETDTSVIWSGFHNHHRSGDKADAWDYSCFPSYEFEKKTYMTALGKLRNIAVSGSDFVKSSEKEITRLRKLYAEIRYEYLLKIVERIN
jgi:hypothetical protein